MWWGMNEGSTCTKDASYHMDEGNAANISEVHIACNLQDQSEWDGRMLMYYILYIHIFGQTDPQAGG
jgi:hypothetical protein